MSADVNELSAPTPRIYAMVAALVLIWGTTFLLVKFALVEAEPALVAAARIIFAAAVLVPFALITGRAWPKDRARLGGAMAVGLFSTALPFSLLAWAQQVVPSGVAGVYMAVIPLLILPMAHFFSPGEIMTRRKLAGFAVGFVGVLMLMGMDTLRAIGSADALAQLACLGAALSYATGSILTRRVPKTDPIGLSAAALLTGSVLIAPFGLAAWPETALSGTTIGILIAVGTISTAFAMVLRVMVITSAGSVFMSSVGYLVPITALAVGVAFGGEVIESSDALAVLLILCGLGIAQNVRLWRPGQN